MSGTRYVSTGQGAVRITRETAGDRQDAKYPAVGREFSRRLRRQGGPIRTAHTKTFVARRAL